MGYRKNIRTKKAIGPLGKMDGEGGVGGVWDEGQIEIQRSNRFVVERCWREWYT